MLVPKKYYYQLFLGGQFFFSYNTDNPQINCISLNDCHSELFFRIVKNSSGGDSSFRFVSFPSSSPANWEDHFFDVMSSGSIYIKHQRGFNPKYVFHHHDVSFKKSIKTTTKRFSPKYIFHHHAFSFKNSNMNNIKEYMPQNHDHQKYGHGNWINVQG